MAVEGGQKQPLLSDGDLLAQLRIGRRQAFVGGRLGLLGPLPFFAMLEPITKIDGKA